MAQRTLVAYYGQKPPQLNDLIRECQHVLCEELTGCFQKYDVLQVHGTIVGFERTPESDGSNLNFAKFRGRNEPMNVAGFLQFLRTSPFFPLSIQIGGFQNREYPFLSRSLPPYVRSFSIQADKAVLLGWPIIGKPAPRATTSSNLFDIVRESRLYPLTLNAIRRSAQSFGILHQYHREVTDIDNDLYLRLGTLRTPLDDAAAPRVEGVMREFLALKQPALIDLALPDLHVVTYDDESLPHGSTRSSRLSDFEIGSPTQR
jgi:hypothetical protein